MEQTTNQSGLISEIALLDYVWDKVYAHKYSSLQQCYIIIFRDINVVHARRERKARVLIYLPYFPAESSMNPPTSD